MKYLIMILLVTGCASVPKLDTTQFDAQNAEEIAFLDATPYELCKQPETARRYESAAECKADIVARQKATRELRTERRQAMLQWLIRPQQPIQTIAFPVTHIPPVGK